MLVVTVIVVMSEKVDTTITKGESQDMAALPL